MKKLENGELSDIRLENEQGDVIDEQFINNQLESYNKLLDSPLMKGLEEPQKKEKYPNLYNACSKYPKIQLHAETITKSRFDNTSPEQLVDTIAEDGFIENYGLSEEKSEKVKQLRLEKNIKK